MASFNLGRIKGDKGERGETGAKGDTGAKGEKGDKGDNGRDGMTPVFSVAKTHTLSSGEAAYTELDTSNPASPVLSFYIPRGKDGKDAMGDMIKAVYDTEGIGTDIYEYARNLANGCMKISGGTLGGALKAAESAASEGAVRNISVLSDLPQGGAEGDICIILERENSKKLGDCTPGNIMYIEENGKETAYLIAALNHHAEDSVTLVRENLCPDTMRYDINYRGEYMMSDIDVYLETIYKGFFSQQLQGILMPVKLRTDASRHCFILKENDFEEIEYFKTQSNRIALYELSKSPTSYMTRTLGTSTECRCVTETGTIITKSAYEEHCYRPVIVLPADLAVVNTEQSGLPAVRLPESKHGIYVRIHGEWKECV